MMDNTTAALARRVGIQAQSLRSAVCRKGSYYGVVPKKMPNGRLLWPDDAFERITAADTRTEGGHK